MIPKYVSRAPSSKRYADGRLPEGERMGDKDWITKKLQHSTSVDITPRHVVEQNKAAQAKRVNEMFANMKAVESVPVARRGRDGVDLTTTEEYKALASMPVTDKEDPRGWFAVDCGTEDKAKKQQAMVNRYAVAGAGTFRTRLLKGTATLYVKRISETYAPQRSSAAPNASED